MFCFNTKGILLLFSTMILQKIDRKAAKNFPHEIRQEIYKVLAINFDKKKKKKKQQSVSYILHRF